MEILICWFRHLKDNKSKRKIPTYASQRDMSYQNRTSYEWVEKSQFEIDRSQWQKRRPILNRTGIAAWVLRVDMVENSTENL